MKLTTRRHLIKKHNINFQNKAILILSMALFFGQSFSQEPRQIKKHSVGLGVGQTFLISDFADNGEDSITAFDLYHSYSVSYSFDLFSNIHYSSHSKGANKTKLMGINTSIKSRLYEFDSFSPYLMGGLGFYSPKLTRTIGSRQITSDSKFVFGFNLGAGIDLSLSKTLTLGLLAHYHHPLKVAQDGQPSINGSYLKILMALFYKFP